MAKQKEKKDTINDALSKNEALLTKHKKTIIIVIIVIILVIAGVLCYRTYVSEPREQEASTALAKGQEYFAGQLYELALAGDSINFKGLLSVISDYKSTKAGNLANLYAGLCYANLDQWDNAVRFLDAFSTKNDQMISPASVAALGNAYAHVKQYDKAVENLKKAAKMADSKAEDGVNNSLSPVFLLQAGEILESQNKKSEALKIYEDIKSKYVTSRVHAEIDKYIERVSVK